MESIEEHGKSSRLVLVAIDESEESVNALHWALNNVLTSQDRIILIHAQRPPNSLFTARRPARRPGQFLQASVSGCYGDGALQIPFSQLEDLIRLFKHLSQAATHMGFMVPADVLKTFENDVKKSTEKILAEATEICKAKNLTVETEAYTGDAREVICNAAQTYNPDMLVIGSHGYGALKRVVLGSVSDYCVHYVQCPVVVVKPRMIKTQ